MGITYEFWKMWLPKRKGNKKQKKKKEKEENKKEERTITISKLLKTVYMDIEQFGMEDDSFNVRFLHFYQGSHLSL